MREADNEILVRYLLGELSEAELERVENYYFSDGEVFEQLLIVEDEIIDAYVRGELSIEEGERFAEYFLQSPERREKIAFAEAWQAFIAKQHQTNHPHQPDQQPQSAFKQKSFLIPLAASVILAVGAALLLIDRMSLKGDLDRAQSQIARLEERQRSLEDRIGEQASHSEELSRILEEERIRQNNTSTDQSLGEQISPATVVFALSASGSRGGGESKPLIINSETKQVQLRASFSSYDYTRFSAVLKTLDGAETHRWSDLKPRLRQSTGTIVLALPADKLSDGYYTLIVSGATSSRAEEVVEEYAVRVVRR